MKIFLSPFSYVLDKNSIGKGFSIDDINCLKNNVFNYEKNDIIPSKKLKHIENVVLIKENQLPKKIMGDVCLAFGYGSNVTNELLFSGNVNSGETLNILYRKVIVSKTLFLHEEAKPIIDFFEIVDIDSLKNQFGLYFVKKIKYGAILNLVINLQSSNKELMKKLENNIEELKLLNIGNVLSLIKNTDQSQIKITTKMDMGGIINENIPNYQNLDDLESFINLFNECSETSTPVAIKLSKIKLTSEFIEFEQHKEYKNKESQIATYYWEMQQIIVQLESWININSENSKNKIYMDKLKKETSNLTSSIKKLQNDLLIFAQDSIETILENDIPYSKTKVCELRDQAQCIIGKRVETSEGIWFGPSIKGVPIYEGAYNYLDGGEYEGLCLNGKRHGQGILRYAIGNIEQLKSIEGEWENDNASFPSVVTYNDNKVVIITNSDDCSEWKEEHKKRLISVKVTNCSSDDENVVKIDVKVELVQDEAFQNLYKKLHKLSISNKKYQYSFIFMGMTGTGKTTFVEFILNILTGQVHSPTTLRAQDIENQGIGESKTNSVCSYEIRYYYRNQWKFGITIIDTPGFADVGGLDKDREHIKSILNNVGKLENLDSVSYVVNGGLTRKTLEPLRVLCNVFSILPNEAFNCVSTIVSFCDNNNQADSVRDVLNQMLPGINEKPLLFMDNPWAQHLNNIYRSNKGPDEASKNSGILFGVDNTDELEKKMSAKIEIINRFFINIFDSQKSFKPEGMNMLQELKDELLSKLKELAIIVEKLSTVTRLYTELTDDKISSLIEKSKLISIEEWLKDRGFAFINGKPQAKVMGKNPWPGGVYSTVCYAPECVNMVCHEGCSLDFTPIKGDNIFTKCWAFDTNQCRICNQNCSHKQHVHVKYQLEWFENDHVLDAFNAIKLGATEALNKSKEYEEHAKKLKAQYSSQLCEFSELKNKFKNLSVLGDIRLILDSLKRTYEQHHEIAIQAQDNEKADNIQKILDQFKLFIEALNATDEYKFDEQFGQVKVRRNEKVSLLNSLFSSFGGFPIGL
ncbi:hypothetical protein DICPUDRAFT_98949 [Dictyostelium purpureum]|uniref:G domain-containing protein n=1 Tax=Dictyostelium purpureum TaxID=5786 RepID=F0ZUZ1_DICPU|nr:uncharacterized protein DICPUDRAFT_98949 [Dictyostelium purpureum]EGC32233.1 hypothetical protein DICPUDRAFT_98949 [Dictyostelium purpureum]|eukprot:XP_003291231.1 hypothetical protein DICPUDRAFT_98949 [Dictyostelium purpureum]